jgi:hypothetical protein
MNVRKGVLRSIMTISRKTRVNWILDVGVFISALFAGISGIYFLYVPSGGYQGGRNLWYGVTIIFDRHTWSDMHTWGSVVLIIAIVVHFIYHWQWVRNMMKKILRSFSPAGSRMSKGGMVNLWVNILIGISFLLTALSGVYLLFIPSGGFQGGSNLGWDPGFLFSRTTWDLVHAWSGVVMIITAMFHFIIHWRWIKNVTSRIFHLAMGNASKANRPFHRSKSDSFVSLKS